MKKPNLGIFVQIFFNNFLSNLGILCFGGLKEKTLRPHQILSIFHYQPNNHKPSFFFLFSFFSPLFFIPPIITPTKWSLKPTQARIKVFFIYLFVFFGKTNTHTQERQRDRERERERERFKVFFRW